MGILPIPFGIFILSAKKVARLLSYIRDLWSEGSVTVTDEKLNDLQAMTLDNPAYDRLPASTGQLLFRQKVDRMLRMLWATRILPARFGPAAVPNNAIYLNIGQLGLARASFFDWLGKRPDITCAMMLHDIIPIDHPHLVGPRAPAHHRQMVRTAAGRADCLIYNSAYTRDCVSELIHNLGRRSPPELVRSPPLPAAFFDAVSGIEALCDTRNFIAVSTIERRKNYDPPLRVWQRLIAEMGSAALTGPTGWSALIVSASSAPSPMSDEGGARRNRRAALAMVRPKGSATRATIWPLTTASPRSTSNVVKPPRVVRTVASVSPTKGGGDWLGGAIPSGSIFRSAMTRWMPATARPITTGSKLSGGLSSSVIAGTPLLIIWVSTVPVRPGSSLIISGPINSAIARARRPGKGIHRIGGPA